MTKNRTPTPVYLDPGMHSGLEVKGLKRYWLNALCLLGECSPDPWNIVLAKGSLYMCVNIKECRSYMGANYVWFWYLARLSWQMISSVFTDLQFSPVSFTTADTREANHYQAIRLGSERLSEPSYPYLLNAVKPRPVNLYTHISSRSECSDQAVRRGHKTRRWTQGHTHRW